MINFEAMGVLGPVREFKRKDETVGQSCRLAFMGGECQFEFLPGMRAELEALEGRTVLLGGQMSYSENKWGVRCGFKASSVVENGQG